MQVKQIDAATKDDTTMRDAIDNNIDGLIALLQSADATVRQRAAFDLGRNTQRAAPALIKLKQLMYEDSSPEVQLAAAEAVSRIEGNGNNAILALKQQLQDNVEKVAQLLQSVEHSTDDSSLNTLFERLGHIEKIINVIGSIGASASEVAPDLVTMLEKNLGDGYRDLVPSIGRALQAMGPAAASVLPELEDYAKSKPGKQNRKAINAAIDSIKGKLQKTPPPDPLINID